jgi:hypothetical protein
MDAPREEHSEHWDLVALLAISSLYLAANQTYRGYCQLVFDRRHACRADELTPDEWPTFFRRLVAVRRVDPSGTPHAAADRTAGLPALRQAHDRPLRVAEGRSAQTHFA